MGAGHRNGASWSRAQCRDVGQTVDGQCSNVRHIVRAWIVAVEKIEELDEGNQRPALMEIERSRDPQVRFYIGCSANLIELSLHAVHNRAVIQRIAEAIHIYGSG